MKRILFLAVFSFLLGCINSKAQRPLTFDVPDSIPEEYQKDADKCYQLIEKQAHYLLSIVKTWHGKSQYKLTTASQGGEEHIVRPNTGSVLIFSFLYRFGNYSEELVGISRECLLEENIIPMIRYLVTVHKTGTQTFDNGRRWGSHWQSSLWTHQLAVASTMIWDKIPLDLQQKILTLVRYEADIIRVQNPPFAVNFDTKAEENAWNTGALASALMLMPDDSDAPKWSKALHRWMVTSFMRAKDAECETIVDGKPLKSYYEGANLHDDFTLENHGLVHPDYMSTWLTNCKVMIDYLATKRPLMDAFKVNVEGLYNQLKLFSLPTGRFIFPCSYDGSAFCGVSRVNMHLFALYFFREGTSLYWFRQLLEIADGMQQRYESGKIYGPDENYFPSGETLLGLSLVDCWIMFHYLPVVSELEPDFKGDRMFPYAKFYVNKSSKSIQSVSWGINKVIQCVHYDKDPIMAPYESNGTGTIRLAGDKKDLPVTVVSLKVDTLKDGMHFDMVIHHGDAVKADLAITSLYDGKMELTEKLTALKKCSTAHIETLSFGIYNHFKWPCEMGYRTLYAGHKKYRINAKSGIKIPVKGRKFNVDNKLVIESKHPSVGKYFGAVEWNRSKLIDRLVLNCIEGENNWDVGEVISQNSLLIYYK